MPSAKVDQLQEQIAKKRAHIEMLADRAADENGSDLTEEEMGAIEALNEEIAGAKRQLDLLVQDTEVSQETAQRLRSIGAGVVSGDFKYRSAGQLLWDCLHQTNADAQKRYARAMRAAEHM